MANYLYLRPYYGVGANKITRGKDLEPVLFGDAICEKWLAELPYFLRSVLCIQEIYSIKLDLIVKLNSAVVYFF